MTASSRERGAQELWKQTLAEDALAEAAQKETP